MTPDVGYTPAVTMPESSVRDEGSVTRISRPRYLPGHQPPIAARHTYRNSPGSLFRPGAGLLLAMVVLESQQRIYPAQNAQAQIRLGRLVAYVQLYKALGGEWNLKDPQLPPSTAEAQEPAACADKKC